MRLACSFALVASLASSGCREPPASAPPPKAPVAPSPTPSPVALPQTLAEQWRLLEWFPERIGTWAPEDAQPFVGATLLLAEGHADVPGHRCGKVKYRVSDTRETWSLFEKCGEYQPQLDCRDISIHGRDMLKCAGRETAPPPMPHVEFWCPEGNGIWLWLEVSQLTATRAMLSLPDGHGSFCLEVAN